MRPWLLHFLEALGIWGKKEEMVKRGYKNHVIFLNCYAEQINSLSYQNAILFCYTQDNLRIDKNRGYRQYLLIMEHKFLVV